MLKHVVPAHRSSSSLNNSPLSPQSFCSPQRRRSSLTAVESSSRSPSCGKCIYRRAASCDTPRLPPSHGEAPLYEGRSIKCDLIREEGTPCKFPQIEENNNVVEGFCPSGSTESARGCQTRTTVPNSARSFVEMVNRNDSVPRSIHEFDLDDRFNSTTDTSDHHQTTGTPSETSSHSCFEEEEEDTSSIPYDDAHCYQRLGLHTPTSHRYARGCTPLPYNHSLLSKSCTLPRREIVHNEEVRRSSFRSNASTSSLLSSVSCSSLSSVRNLNSRFSSTSSLLETVAVKIYLRRLRSDMEYKTVSLSLQTTCKELVVILLTKFRLRHRDPNLFFVLMEVTVRSPSDGAPVKRQLVLEDHARPAELQQCRPKGEANFSIGVRRGGLIRVHDSILMQGSQYKSLMVAYHTTAEELVRLVLKCYNSLENPMNYALHEVCKNPYCDRPLAPDECPLKTQWEWPKSQRNNRAFFLRRNLTYAFSLKSRMLSRCIESHSQAADGDGGFEEDSLRTSRHSSSPDSRSSSVSSSSSVSRTCHSSSPDSRSSVSSTSSSASSSTSSSEKSVDSGFGSPLSSAKASEQINKISLPMPMNNSSCSPSTTPSKAEKQESNRIGLRPIVELPPKPTLSPQKISSLRSFQNLLLDKKVAQKPIVVTPKCLTPKGKEEPNASGTSPAKSLSNAQNIQPAEASQSTPKSVLPITASVSRLSLNSPLPSLTSTPIPTSSSTPTGKELQPKPRQRTIITITGTTRSSSTGQVELQRRHLRPVIPPPSLKIKSNLITIPVEETNTQGAPKDTLHTDKTTSVEPKTSPPTEPSVKNTSSKAERDLMEAIESLRSLSDQPAQKSPKSQQETLLSGAKPPPPQKNLKSQQETSLPPGAKPPPLQKNPKSHQETPLLVAKPPPP